MFCGQDIRLRANHLGQMVKGFVTHFSSLGIRWRITRDLSLKLLVFAQYFLHGQGHEASAGIGVAENLAMSPTLEVLPRSIVVLRLVEADRRRQQRRPDW